MTADEGWTSISGAVESHLNSFVLVQHIMPQLLDSVNTRKTGLPYTVVVLP